eukprot:evm.model.NODE_10969_length_1119_cov_7.530831.1
MVVVVEEVSLKILAFVAEEDGLRAFQKMMVREGDRQGNASQSTTGSLRTSV